MSNSPKSFLYCEHFNDQRELDELRHKDNNFSLGSRVDLMKAGSPVRLNRSSYGGDEDLVTEYLDKYGQEELEKFVCPYCRVLENKNPSVFFLYSDFLSGKTGTPEKFVRLKMRNGNLIRHKIQLKSDDASIRRDNTLVASYPVKI